jgi:hypothetical protein
MFNKDKTQLVSPCGYCCPNCAAHVESTCTDQVAIEKEFRWAKVNGLDVNSNTLKGLCPGCRPNEGKIGKAQCQTYDCCLNKKNLDFCYECDEFPCLKLAPVSYCAEIRRHNTKIYNLLMLKKLGLAEYIQQSGEMHIRWARGKTSPPGSDVQL